MKILLIAGHGDGDCGATGFGLKEADLTREMVNLTKPYLEGCAEVDIASPNKNWYDYICKKKNSFNFKPYNYVLEIHFNACVKDFKGNGYTTGTEAYVTYAEDGTTVEEGIVKNISALGLKNRGVIKKNWSLINYIKKQGVSSALLEICFIDDADDMAIYKAKKEEIAKAIAKGIIDGFKLTKPVDELEEACNLLAEKGIINSPAYWAKGTGYSEDNIKLLIKKFAAYVKGVG